MLPHLGPESVEAPRFMATNGPSTDTSPAVLAAHEGTDHPTVFQHVAARLRSIFPKFNKGYIMPALWQDFVALVELGSGALLVLYVCYRLFKYVFRAEGVPTSTGGN